MGNFHSKEDADNNFYTKNAIINNFYNKKQYDEQYATAADIDMTKYYDKTEEDARYLQKGVLDDYYDKNNYNSKYIPNSFNDELANTYYNKSQYDSMYMNKNDSHGIGDIQNSLNNYYTKDDITNQNFPETQQLTNAFNGRYTAYDITNGFSDHDQMGALINASDTIIPPIKNNYYFKSDAGSNVSGYIRSQTGLYDSANYENLVYSNLGLVYTSPFMTRQTLYDGQVTFPYQSYYSLVNKNFTDNGVVTCFVTILDLNKNVDGSIFLYYGEGISPVLVSGCSVRYVSGSDYPIYSNSFSYPVRKGSTAVFQSWGVSINSDAQVKVLKQLQPYRNVSVPSL